MEAYYFLGQFRYCHHFYDIKHMKFLCVFSVCGLLAYVLYRIKHLRDAERLKQKRSERLRRLVRVTSGWITGENLHFPGVLCYSHKPV